MISPGIYFKHYSEFRQLVGTLLGDNVFPKQVNVIPYFGDSASSREVMYVGVLPSLSVGTSITVTVTGLSPVTTQILESSGLYFIEFVAPYGDFVVETVCASPQLTARQYFRAINFHTFTASLADASSPETTRGLQIIADQFLTRLDVTQPAGAGLGATLQGSANDTAANNNFGKLIGFERYARDWSAAAYRNTLGGGTELMTYTRTAAAAYSAGTCVLLLPFTPEQASVVVTKNGAPLTVTTDYAFTTASTVTLVGSVTAGDVFVVTGDVVKPGLMPTMRYGGTFGALTNIVKSITGYQLPDASVTSIQNDAWKTPSYVDDYHTDLLMHFIADAGSTSIYDDSRLRNAVSSTAPLSNADAKFLDTSALFTGTEAITATPTTALNYTTNDFTIEMYVKLTSTAGDQTLVSRKDDDSNFWQLLKTGPGRLAFRIMTGGTYTLNIQTPMLDWSTSVWYHIALVRYGNVLMFFKNGILEHSETIDAATTLQQTADYVFGLFSRPSVPYTANLTAYLDEVRISSVARFISDFLPRETKYIGPKYYFAPALAAGTFVDVDPDNLYNHFSLLTSGTQVGSAAEVQPCERKANTVLAEIISDGVVTTDEPILRSSVGQSDPTQYVWLNPYAEVPDIGFEAYTDEHVCTGPSDKTITLTHDFNEDHVCVYVNGIAITPHNIDMTTRETSAGQYVYPTNPGAPYVVGTFSANAALHTVTLDADVTVAAGDVIIVRSYNDVAVNLVREFVVLEVVPAMPYTLQLTEVPMPGTVRVYLNGSQLDYGAGDFSVSAGGLLSVSVPSLSAGDGLLICYVGSFPLAWANERQTVSGSLASTWTPAYTVVPGTVQVFVNGIAQSDSVFTLGITAPHVLTFDATWLATLTTGDVVQVQYMYYAGNIIVRQLIDSAYVYYLQTVHFNVNYTTGSIIWKTGVPQPDAGATYLCTYTYFQKDLIENMLNRIKAATTKTVLRFTTTLGQSFIPGLWGGAPNPGADVII